MAICRTFTPKGVPQSQNFSNLPHRRSLGGHRLSPLHGQKGGLVRDSIADIERFKAELMAADWLQKLGLEHCLPLAKSFG
jgi:hypothetical protein